MKFTCIVIVAVALLATGAHGACEQSNVYGLFNTATKTCGVSDEHYCSDECKAAVLAASTAGQACDSTVLRGIFCGLAKAYEQSAQTVHSCAGWEDFSCDVSDDTGCLQGDVTDMFSDAAQECGLNSDAYCSAACAAKVKSYCEAGQTCRDPALKYGNCDTCQAFHNSANKVHSCPFEAFECTGIGSTVTDAANDLVNWVDDICGADNGNQAVCDGQTKCSYCETTKKCHLVASLLNQCTTDAAKEFVENAYKGLKEGVNDAEVDCGKHDGDKDSCDESSTCNWCATSSKCHLWGSLTNTCTQDSIKNWAEGVGEDVGNVCGQHDGKEADCDDDFECTWCGVGSSGNAYNKCHLIGSVTNKCFQDDAKAFANKVGDAFESAYDAVSGKLKEAGAAIGDICGKYDGDEGACEDEIECTWCETSKKCHLYASAKNDCGFLSRGANAVKDWWSNLTGKDTGAKAYIEAQKMANQTSLAKAAAKTDLDNANAGAKYSKDQVQKNAAAAPEARQGFPAVHQEGRRAGRAGGQRRPRPPQRPGRSVGVRQRRAGGRRGAELLADTTGGSASLRASLVALLAAAALAAW